MSLCGSRSRVGRSPSLSFAEQPDSSDALPPFHHARKEERKVDDEFAASSESAYCDGAADAQQLKQQQRLTADSDDDEAEQQAPHRPFTHAKLRRDKTSAALSAYSSSSSLQTSPHSASDHNAYYTTDEESPLSGASSSSSLSAQASPPRTFTVPTYQRQQQQHYHSSSSQSHTITVTQPTAHLPLVNSHPATQHRIDVASMPQSSLHFQQHRTLTTSLSTSCLHRASYMAESSDEEVHSNSIPHSRSHAQLHAVHWQQQQQQHRFNSGPIQVSRLTATHSYSSSSVGLSITRPTASASSSYVSSSPDSAPPAASYPSTDSQPLVTHNAVITIRPNVSAINLTAARTFRTHRRPLALDSPTPSPRPTSDVDEDDSPLPTHSRSLFRPATPSSGSVLGGGVVCHSGLLMACEPVSPGSYPGTCLSILRAQRVATVC